MKTFQCLRCDHRFPVKDYDPKASVERACPRCGSNSVRPQSEKSQEGGRDGPQRPAATPGEG